VGGGGGGRAEHGAPQRPPLAPPVQERAARVEATLLRQALGAATALRRALADAGESVESGAVACANPPPPLGGLAAAVGGAGGAAPTAAPPATPSSATLASLTPLFAHRHGHALAVRPSSIPGAGDGVFAVRGIPAGALAALYPGTAYSPLQVRAMPGYPRVDAASDYLVARYDGVILDAGAWGRPGGARRRPRPAGAPPAAGAAAEAEADLQSLDARHPLALGHVANHPPEGTPPNVALAAFDVPPSALGADPGLRPFIPVLPVGGPGARAPSAGVPCLGLVALTAVADGGELLLNYRLSSRLARPGWYAPVDDDEDARRWA